MHMAKTSLLSYSLQPLNQLVSLNKSAAHANQQGHTPSPPLIPGAEIIRGPQTVSNATLGGTASFECIINSELALPRWNINGIDYTVTRLPAGIQFESNSFYKVLTVSSVQQEMNNWCFYCFLLFVNDDRVESTRAKLIIPPPIVTPTYSISSQSTGIAATAISSTLPLSTHFSTLVSKSIPLHTTPVLDNTKGSSSQFICNVLPYPNVVLA